MALITFSCMEKSALNVGIRVVAKYLLPWEKPGVSAAFLVVYATRNSTTSGFKTTKIIFQISIQNQVLRI